MAPDRRSFHDSKDEWIRVAERLRSRRYETLFSHPTLGESLNNPFMNVEDIQSSSA